MIKSAFLKSFTWIISVMLGTLFLGTVLPVLETKFFPVFVQEKIFVDRQNELVNWSANILKLRACKFVSISYTLQITDPKVLTKQSIPINVTSSKVRTSPPLYNYSLGEFDLGPFQTILPGYLIRNNTKNMSLIGVAYYNCKYVPWLTKSILGPVQIPDKDTNLQ